MMKKQKDSESRADKIWDAYNNAKQDLETLEHICEDNPQAIKQLGFINLDVAKLRAAGLKR